MPAVDRWISNNLLIIDDTGKSFLRDTRIGSNKDDFIIDFMRLKIWSRSKSLHIKLTSATVLII